MEKEVAAFKDKIKDTKNVVKLCLDLTSLVSIGQDPAKADQRLSEELRKIGNGKHDKKVIFYFGHADKGNWLFKS